MISRISLALTILGAGCTVIPEQAGAYLEVSPEPGAWTETFDQVTHNADGTPCYCDNETPRCQALYVAQVSAQPEESSDGIWSVNMIFAKTTREAAQRSNTYVIYRMLIAEDSDEEGEIDCFDMAGPANGGRSLAADVLEARATRDCVAEYSAGSDLNWDCLTELDDGQRHAVQNGYWPEGETELEVEQIYVWNRGDLNAQPPGTRIVIQIGTEGKDNPDYDPIWYQPDPVTLRKTAGDP